MLEDQVKDPMSIISMPDYLTNTRPVIPLTNLRQFDKPIYSGKENLAYVKLDTRMAEYERVRGQIMNNYHNVVQDMAQYIAVHEKSERANNTNTITITPVS